MSDEQYDLNPFGESETKRLTVPEAEFRLFRPVKLEHGVIRLVDYIGGDEAILYAATGGVGRSAIKKGGGVYNLFNYLKKNRILNPFKFVQMKLHMEMPISSALFWVYNERFKINEYSGRYSEMMDEARVVDLPSFLENEKIRDIVTEVQTITRNNYKDLLKADLARELARIGLGLGNYTKFYVSTNLEDLLNAAESARSLSSHSDEDFFQFSREIDSLVGAIAPIARDVFSSAPGSQSKNLEDVILDLGALESKPNGEPRYGISKTKRLTVPEAENLLFKPVPYLDKGWFMPTDYMGSDGSIVQSARISYGSGTKKVSEDKALIRYLRKHKHTTPFEHVSLQAESKTPIVISPRQAGRHRTFDKEGVLGRWVPLKDWYEIPDEEIAAQSKSNRQGRGDTLEDENKALIKTKLAETFGAQSKAREELKNLNAPSWIADTIAGVGHYTRGTYKVDLHNAFHFLRLREDAHAQKEIQLFANRWSNFVNKVAPIAYQAYLDYEKTSINFTETELKLVLRLAKEGLKEIPYPWFKEMGWVNKAGTPEEKLNREATDLSDRIKKIEGII